MMHHYQIIRNLKTIITSIAVVYILISTLHVNAQQDPNFTLYNFNMNIINPAFAGVTETPQITTVYRSQWLGVENSPRTGSIVYSSSLGNNLGLGISVLNDRVFVLDQTDIAADISYKLRAGEETNIYFGMKFGTGLVNIDLNRVNAASNDPVFFENQSFINAHIGAGLYIDSKDFYISISAPNFLNGERYEKQGNTPAAAIENMHFYVGGGVNIDVSKSVVLTPRFMSRLVQGAPASYDVGFSFLVDDFLTSGINYRINELYSIYGMLTFFDRFQLGIAYDITKDRGLINDDGSLEFILKYQFK